MHYTLLQARTYFRSIFLWLGGYHITLFLLRPLAIFYIKRRAKIATDNAILHISYMVHIPWHTTRILRRYGVKADYLALGRSAVWSRADFVFDSSRIPFWRALKELYLFVTLLSRYQSIHLHFGLTPSLSGWEAVAMRSLGRKVILHLRGCECRNREKNMQLHPYCNICQQCDYNASICTNGTTKKRISLLKRHASSILVTTPDMRDFIPQALHFPFFAPDTTVLPPKAATPAELFTIVHITNHPGIEGTEEIQRVISRLQEKGYPITFRFLRGVSYDEALEALRNAHMAIGKMKMGYYANAQIEAMMLGVPTITWIRPDLMTQELQNSAFIFSSLDDLEQTFEYWITHPKELASRASRCRESVLALHDEAKLVQQLLVLYGITERRIENDSNAA